jgi:hypothetical protein
LEKEKCRSSIMSLDILPSSLLNSSYPSYRCHPSTVLIF